MDTGAAGDGSIVGSRVGAVVSVGGGGLVEAVVGVAGTSVGGDAGSVADGALEHAVMNPKIRIKYKMFVFIQ
jgi:hypothetical protein